VGPPPAITILKYFNFSGSKQHTFVSKLSGGEKRRLHLLTILLKNPNFLILDEPTNDLDIITLNVLEDFLLDYPGCLVVVSHDRHFMKKITDHLLVLRRGRVAYDESRADFSRWKGIYETLRRRLDAYRKQLKGRELSDVLRVQPAY
jgi:ATPase subunit of ABC transporter with duplicated ATPase domains